MASQNQGQSTVPLGSVYQPINLWSNPAYAVRQSATLTANSAGSGNTTGKFYAWTQTLVFGATFLMLRQMQVLAGRRDVLPNRYCDLDVHGQWDGNDLLSGALCGVCDEYLDERNDCARDDHARGGCVGSVLHFRYRHTRHECLGAGAGWFRWVLPLRAEYPGRNKHLSSVGDTDLQLA